MPASRLALLLVAAWLALPLQASAQSLDTLSFELTVRGPDEFRGQAERVRASLAEGGSNAGLTEAQRGRVGELLDSIQALFDRHGSAQALDEGDRLVIVNAQNEINAILAHRADEQVTCEFVMRTGSHRRSKQCLTRKQREERRAEAQDALRSNERDNLPRGNPP